MPVGDGRQHEPGGPKLWGNSSCEQDRTDLGCFVHILLGNGESKKVWATADTQCHAGMVGAKSAGGNDGIYAARVMWFPSVVDCLYLVGVSTATESDRGGRSPRGSDRIAVATASWLI